MMKSRIYGGLCLLILICGISAQKDPIQYEVDQQPDYIEITLQIKAQSRTLLDALDNAKKTADKVASLADNYCRSTAKNTKDCKDAVDISEFQIEPKYKMVRKEASFETFVVTHEVIVKVFDTDSIGQLADVLLNYPDLTILNFEWQALNELDSEEVAIKQGIEQADTLCKPLGLTFGKILNVQEIILEEEEAEQQEEEQSEEEPQVVIYKFQIECVPPPKKAKTK